MSELELGTENDTIVVRRRFAATPEAVYRAHLDPALLQRWCLGPDGWTMPVCINEGKVGGKMRYEWSHTDGRSFYLTGEILALDPPHRIEHVERMHLPDVTPDNRVVTTFEADGSGTRLTLRMSLPDATARRKMLASGMDRGMEASYVRLERLAVEEAAS